MTISFRILSFLCLFAAFIWQIGSETQWVTANHEEEEEKKINIVFSNQSFKSTLPPLEDVSTSVTPDSSKEEAATTLHLPVDDTRRKIDFDELHASVNKNDASPENSVEREEDDDSHKDVPSDETSAVEDDSKESSVEYAGTFSDEKRTESLEDVSEVDEDATTSNASCVEGDARCKNASGETLGRLASPKVEETGPVTASNAFTPSYSSSIWNLFKSRKPFNEASPTYPMGFTPFKSTFGSDERSTTTESSSTTAQTADNLIPVEDTAINKLDTANDPHINKTDKAKATKLAESPSSTSVDRQFRTFVKPLTTVPVTVAEKDSKDDAGSTTSQPKMFETLIPRPVFSNYDFNFSTIVWFASTPSRDFSSDFFSPSPVLDYAASSEPEPSSVRRQPESPLFTTASWQNDKPAITSSDEAAKEKVDRVSPEPSPSLLPSFRESSATPVNKIPGGRITSSHEVTPEPSAHAESSSSPDQPAASTIQPQLSSRSVVKDSPSVNSAEEAAVPRPRLTNPGCSSLPVCIEITLLDITWGEFCPQAREFQDFVAKDVSHIIHAIHAHQVVLEADYCVSSQPVYPVQASSGVTVALFVTDASGEYNERLTEVCALILRKWAPTTFRNSVMEVRLFNNELQGTPLPIIPELNSGFVAAVSISAVAGVALCMLCILLVVMKQKLLQSRNSDTATPAGDAYSLDSLSINASFRRRRNRKSARSYLNHAFSDQEIPSHPLNEKSLHGCLKNREYLEDEYKKIPLRMPKLDQIPEGAHVKNRYSNILPRPETRVLLADPSGDPLKCYINANYVKGHAGKSSTYIACQAPLPDGIEDFWRMVWEQQSRVIIMLTMFEENGISRCSAYFPESTIVSHPPYGDFQVSLLKKEVYEFYTMSTFRLLEMEKNLFRDVVHLWYTNWPDVGVPKDPSTLIYFVQQCRSFINCNAAPTIVHCSTGTGRTGVFIALDLSMREYDESRSIDILQCVSQLRLDRGGAVQNKDQYILIHEAMQEYISRIANQSQRSSIQS